MRARPEYTIKRSAERFLKQLDKANATCGGAYSCEHGHLGCSTFERGPCMDEVLSNFPELAESND